MQYLDMRKLLAAPQEERQAQGIGLSHASPIYDAIAVQVGLQPRITLTEDGPQALGPGSTGGTRRQSRRRRRA